MYRKAHEIGKSFYLQILNRKLTELFYMHALLELIFPSKGTQQLIFNQELCSTNQWICLYSGISDVIYSDFFILLYSICAQFATFLFFLIFILSYFARLPLALFISDCTSSDNKVREPSLAGIRLRASKLNKHDPQIFVQMKMRTINLMRSLRNSISSFCPFLSEF